MRKILQYLLLLVLYLSIGVNVTAQNQILVDSLLVELEENTGTEEQADILLHLSSLYWKNDYRLAIEYSEKAIALVEDGEPSGELAKAYRFVGNSYLFAGNYEEALENFFQGLSVADKVGDLHEQFALNISIGAVYDRITNHAESEKYNFKALQIFNHSKGTEYEAIISRGAVSLFNNIGNNYYSGNEFEKAIEYYKEGLNLAKKENDLSNIGILSNNLGKIYGELKDSAAALEYFTMSEKARLESKDKSGLAFTYYYLAGYYFNSQDFIKALDYGTKAFNLSNEVGALVTVKSSADLLSQIYEIEGNYKEAFYFHKVLKSVSDSLFNEQTVREMARIKFQKEQAVIDSERFKESQKEKVENTILILLLVTSLLILATVAVVANYRQKRLKVERQEIEGRINQKKKELATNVLYLLRKNETLESVTKKLLELKKKEPKGSQQEIQSIILELQSEIDTNSWQEFELRFQDVHQGFYDRLQKTYPDLTPTERKLAAFLKLNMSSKEISVITGQSVRSLEVARYRLRKKLGITNKEVNLVNFLSEI